MQKGTGCPNLENNNFDQSMFPVLHSQKALAAAQDLIVVDGLCPRIGELIPGALQELVALGRSNDPLRQITLELARRRQQGQPVGTLHLVAHGRPGAFQIGREWIDAILDAAPLEEILNRHKPDEVLSHYKPDEVLSHYKPDEVLSHYNEEQIRAYLEKIQQLKH